MIANVFHGSVVDEETDIKLDFIRTINAKDAGTRPLTIYSWTHDALPDHTRYGGCTKIATFYLDFSSVELSQFPKRLVGGQTMHRVDIQYVPYPLW